MRRLRLPLLIALGLALLGVTDSLTRTPPPPARSAGAGPEPRWFKGNLHTHSLWSDGDDYPEMIADWYRRHGYHFLALTDHDRLSKGRRWADVAWANLRAKSDAFGRYRDHFGDEWVETRTVFGRRQVRLKPLNEFRSLFEQVGRFLLIQGEEITDQFGGKPIHLNVCNLEEPIKPQRGRGVAETIANNLAAAGEQRRRLQRPILAQVNHPRFQNAITAEALAEAVGARFVEVYNGHPSVHHRGDRTHASVERIWDIVNTIRVGEMKAAPAFGLATDDAHHYFGKGAEPGRGWVMVRARHLTPESIIKAMEAGDFYASSGVLLRRLSYSRESRRLELEIEPDGWTRYTTWFIGTMKGYDPKREPVLDDDGKPLPVTLRYSLDVGRVLATVEGTSAAYDLTGQELYVRAVVMSSRSHPNPSLSNQFEQAWTQPVGWETWVRPPAPGPEHDAVAAEPEDGP